MSVIELIWSKGRHSINKKQTSRRTKEVVTNIVHVGSEGLYNFNVSTWRTTDWSCLPLPPSPCSPRSAHASPSPVTYQNGDCFKSTIITCSGSQTRLLHWDPGYIHLCTAVTVVVNLNMFPLSLQVLCFRCTFAIFQTALIKCTCK